MSSARHPTAWTDWLDTGEGGIRRCEAINARGRRCGNIGFPLCDYHGVPRKGMGVPQSYLETLPPPPPPRASPS